VRVVVGHLPTYVGPSVRTEPAKELILMAGGDIGPIEQPVDRLADLVLPTLAQADFRVAVCERLYSRRGVEQEWTLRAHTPSHSGRTARSSKHVLLDPELSSIFKTASIDVVSLASNHGMEWGEDAMLDTLTRFRSLGSQTIGAGVNPEEARAPALVEKHGIKVAILGYCSVLHEGQASSPGRPGVAPLRATTSYEPIYYAPGAPPLIVSVPLEQDLEAMREDIAKAKAKADAVVIFVHWGLSHMPKTTAMYETTAAHAAIDAGADIVIGHGPHVLKGVEVYKGKVCFYSIGNFLTHGSFDRRKTKAKFAVWGLIWNKLPDYAEDNMYFFPSDWEKSLLCKVYFSKKGVEKVAFLPLNVNKFCQPEVLEAEDPRFSGVVEYLEWVSDQLPHTFKVKGNEVVVEA
jgi:Bacterial capsule synthesis protein PGA_cap